MQKCPAARLTTFCHGLCPLGNIATHGVSGGRVSAPTKVLCDLTRPQVFTAEALDFLKFVCFMATGLAGRCIDRLQILKS